LEVSLLASLASQSDATAYGYGTITEGMFARASARVRGYVRQQITAGTSTITVRGPIVLLPERPVTAITSVTDEVSEPDLPYTLLADEWELRVGGVLQTPKFGGNLQVSYTHGFANLPDELIELVCQLATRLTNVNQAAASGVQQETGGSESVTLGFDSYNAISELSTGEKRVLDRLFPKRAGVVVLRP
jgi:hypothetical protein